MAGGKVRNRIFGAGTAMALALTMLLPGSAAKLEAQSEFGFDWVKAAGKGWFMEQGRSARWELAQVRKLNKAIAAIQPQRPGIVDAYVVSLSLDSDAVFAHEAAEAAKVLTRRYSSAGRSILLTSGSSDDIVTAPQGSPANLDIALAAVASKMNTKEDVLVLFITSHGSNDTGLAYKDKDNGWGLIAPKRLAALLDELGIERRLVVLSACYSGTFLPYLNGDQNITITAAAANRTSFGCQPSSDWTFFGDALINNALRKPQPLDKAAEQAFALIGQWEAEHRLIPSNPQIYTGDKASAWLTPLEARMPKTELPRVGRPVTSTLQ